LACSPVQSPPGTGQLTSRADTGELLSFLVGTKLKADLRATIGELIGELDGLYLMVTAPISDLPSEKAKHAAGLRRDDEC
jgi:hypothetical protein